MERLRSDYERVIYSKAKSWTRRLSKPFECMEQNMGCTILKENFCDFEVFSVDNNWVFFVVVSQFVM